MGDRERRGHLIAEESADFDGGFVGCASWPQVEQSSLFEPAHHSTEPLTDGHCVVSASLGLLGADAMLLRGQQRLIAEERIGLAARPTLAERSPGTEPRGNHHDHDQRSDEDRSDPPTGRDACRSLEQVVHTIRQPLQGSLHEVRIIGGVARITQFTDGFAPGVISPDLNAPGEGGASLGRADERHDQRPEVQGEGWLESGPSAAFTGALGGLVEPAARASCRSSPSRRMRWST